MSRAVRTVLAIAFGIGLIAGLGSSDAGQLFRKQGVFLLAFLVPCASLVALLWLRTGRPTTRRLREYAPELILCACMLLALVSSFPLHRWFYFLRWQPEHVGFFKSELVRWILWTSILTPLFTLTLRKLWVGLSFLFLVAQVMCFHSLMAGTGGVALYRTDHPSFMFRLFEFSRTFPQLVNYNPYWNGGTLHYVGVTSGTAAPGLILFPFLRMMPVHQVYTYGVGFIFIILVPWIAAGSIRAMGGDRTAMAAAGILALGVSQHFFLWMLHFGTIGAATAGAMILPVSALSFRVVWLDRREKWLAAALILSSFFLLLWPPGALMGAAVAAAYVVNMRQWTRRKWIFLLGCGAALVLLYLPWLLVQLNEAESVVQYATTSRGGQAAAGGSMERLGTGIAHLLAHVQEGHPALIFLGLGGALVAVRRSIRWWFIPILLVLAVITGWGQDWLPKSQLSRFSIPLFFVAVAPAALLISRLLRVTDIRFSMARALLVVLLVLGAYNVSRIYENKGRARYVVMDDQIETMTRWIKEHTPEGGRVMFAGSCLHAFGRGNVAYLPVLTGREMMADDYYGFPPGTIEYNYPPRRFRKSFDLMKVFFDSYNVTQVITYHDNWKDYFKSHPDFFREELSIPSHDLTITVFSVLRTPRPLLKGAGTARGRFNHIEVELDEPSDEVVLTYNWIEGLKASDGVELFRYDTDEEIGLIGVRPGGARRFTIIYRNLFL